MCALTAETSHADATRVRAILDEAQLQDVTIFASGDLDEYALAILLIARRPSTALGSARSSIPAQTRLT